MFLLIIFIFEHILIIIFLIISESETEIESLIPVVSEQDLNDLAIELESTLSNKQKSIGII